MKAKKRGKRPGLRARSKNARTNSPRLVLPPLMRFYSVEESTPDEGDLVLVQLRDATFRFGLVFKGRFCNYEPHDEEFVTMPHPERIAYWVKIHAPIPRSSTAKAEGETPKAEPPGCSPDGDNVVSIEQAARAAAEDENL